MGQKTKRDLALWPNSAAVDEAAPECLFDIPSPLCAERVLDLDVGARVHGGRRRPTLISALLLHVAEFARPIAAARGLMLKVTVPELPLVSIDAPWVDRALFALILAALRQHEDGEIHLIGAYDPDEGVVLRLECPARREPRDWAGMFDALASPVAPDPDPLGGVDLLVIRRIAQGLGGRLLVGSGADNGDIYEFRTPATLIGSPVPSSDSEKAKNDNLDD